MGHKGSERVTTTVLGTLQLLYYYQVTHGKGQCTLHCCSVGGSNCSGVVNFLGFST
jgi:hypothetical protein